MHSRHVRHDELIDRPDIDTSVLILILFHSNPANYSVSLAS
jgi:hypothetical protein